MNYRPLERRVFDSFTEGEVNALVDQARRAAMDGFGELTCALTGASGCPLLFATHKQLWSSAAKLLHAGLSPAASIKYAAAMNRVDVFEFFDHSTELFVTEETNIAQDRVYARSHALSTAAEHGADGIVSWLLSRNYIAHIPTGSSSEQAFHRDLVTKAAAGGNARALTLVVNALLVHEPSYTESFLCGAAPDRPFFSPALSAAVARGFPEAVARFLPHLRYEDVHATVMADAAASHGCLQLLAARDPFEPGALLPISLTALAVLGRLTPAHALAALDAGTLRSPGVLARAAMAHNSALVDVLLRVARDAAAAVCPTALPLPEPGAGTGLDAGAGLPAGRSAAQSPEAPLTPAGLYAQRRLAQTALLQLLGDSGGCYRLRSPYGSVSHHAAADALDRLLVAAGSAPLASLYTEFAAASAPAARAPAARLFGPDSAVMCLRSDLLALVGFVAAGDVSAPPSPSAARVLGSTTDTLTVMCLETLSRAAHVSYPLLELAAVLAAPAAPRATGVLFISWVRALRALASRPVTRAHHGYCESTRAPPALGDVRREQDWAAFRRDALTATAARVALAPAEGEPELSRDAAYRAAPVLSALGAGAVAASAAGAGAAAAADGAQWQCPVCQRADARCGAPCCAALRVRDDVADALLVDALLRALRDDAAQHAFLADLGSAPVVSLVARQHKPQTLLMLLFNGADLAAAPAAALVQLPVDLEVATADHCARVAATWAVARLCLADNAGAFVGALLHASHLASPPPPPPVPRLRARLASAGDGFLDAPTPDWAVAAAAAMAQQRLPQWALSTSPEHDSVSDAVSVVVGAPDTTTDADTDAASVATQNAAGAGPGAGAAASILVSAAAAAAAAAATAALATGPSAFDRVCWAAQEVLLRFLACDPEVRAAAEMAFPSLVGASPLAAAALPRLGARASGALREVAPAARVVACFDALLAACRPGGPLADGGSGLGGGGLDTDALNAAVAPACARATSEVDGWPVLARLLQAGAQPRLEGGGTVLHALLDPAASLLSSARTVAPALKEILTTLRAVQFPCPRAAPRPAPRAASAAAPALAPTPVSASTAAAPAAAAVAAAPAAAPAPGAAPTAAPVRVPIVTVPEPTAIRGRILGQSTVWHAPLTLSLP